MTIWALTDNRIGNDKQTLALAAALGNFTEIKIEYNILSKLPNRLLGASLLGVHAPITMMEKDCWVICSGRKLSRVARNLKKKYGCKIIQIMWPGGNAKDYDYIIVPEHDKIPDAANVIKITGAITSLKPLTASGNLKKAAVLIGKITEHDAIKLLDILSQNDLEYLITTSRRTNAEAVKIIEAKYKCYKYGSAEPNPYNQYLADADAIIVSGDSVNMITEAAHTGKAVYILETKTKAKFKKLWQKLYSLGIARKLAGKIESYNYQPLDNLSIIKKSLSAS